MDHERFRISDVSRAQLATPPGAAAFAPELHERLLAAFATRSQTEPVRTAHRDGAAPHFVNRLVLETSPYLRQHAHNPVNWYPWSAEAFAQARSEKKPVFLSVGYSTCHWCHVMEEESFEDLEIARLLNERYVAIKVDREERPDVDTIYMRAVQSLTKRGGWPMSVWLDAERRPFFAGTYFPARDGDRGTPNGFLTVARRLADMYRVDPQRIAEAARSVTSDIRTAMSRGTLGKDVVTTEVLDSAAQFFARIYDAEHGGVEGAPKFPSSLPVRVLLREHRRTGDTNALAMAERTLERMAAGGMHDQLAGGFHRYSTDERWLVPHFEKMLYDNALLALAYGEAWQVTQRPDFARVLRTTLDYVLREMTAPEGGFYSATDADSEGEEGTFFVWREAEIRDILGTEAERFNRFYGVTREGNFEGASVLFVPQANEEEWLSLADSREAMRVARERRPAPLRDEKILTAWNGLMISALANGGRMLGEARYVAAAVRAADFMLAELCYDGRLQRSWKDARTTGPGFLEDDAFAIAALLDVFEATFEQRYLAEALRLAGAMETLFADAQNGGWFRTADDHERLIAREKPNYDGAEPSGTSVALMNALRLATITSDDAWRRIAERAMRCYAAQLREQPAALGEMLLALDYASSVPREVVLVWPSGDDAPAELTDALRSLFLPHRALLGAAEGAALDALALLAPVAAGKRAQGQPTVYICERGACRLPLTDPLAMTAELQERTR